MLRFPAVVLTLALGRVFTWTPCLPSATFPTNDESDKFAECTTYAAPLCHPGICETPNSANSTIDVFVRRIPAMMISPKRAPNVWFIRGVASSQQQLDDAIMDLYPKLNSEVNLYTMDYRGTGQSTALTCEAVAQSSQTSGLDPKLVPACAKELEETYGDLAAFSITSAAMDVVKFISDYGNDFSTTLYGLGVGSMVVERIMHLDPPEVTGYVLDGVTTTSGSSLDNFFNVSSYDVAFGEVADAFMALCSDDSSCSARFKKKGLKATVHGLMRKLDKTPKSTCAQLVKTLKFGEDEDPPSFALRYLFGTLLADTNMRPLIPVVAHRLLRCEKKDVDVLTKLFEISNLDVKSDPSETLISDLVTVSEMWEAPSPSAQELKASFQKVSMSAAMAFQQVSLYCAMSKEKSPTCDKLKLGNYKGNGIIYERDEYWNKAAKIPDQASVLLLNGGLDPVRPNKNAEALLEALDGGNKELITFTYATDINIAADSCGMAIFASFVQGEGDLSKLNKTCVQNETPLSWTVPAVLQEMLLGTEDAYDGEYDSNLGVDVGGGSSSDSGSSEDFE